MVQLTRQARPLLTRVGGKQHASSDDHEEDVPHAIPTSDKKRRKSTRTQVESSMPTPPGTNSTVGSQIQVIDLQDDEDAINAGPVSEDEAFINADPISSGDERTARKDTGVATGGFVKLAATPVKSKKVQKEESVFKFAAVDEVKSRRHGKKSESSGSEFKRGPQLTEAEREPEWMASTPKKRKKVGGPVNIHAGPKPPWRYGKDGQKAKEREQVKKTSSFKGMKTSPKKKVVEWPSFRSLDIGHGPGAASIGQDFATPGATNGDEMYPRPGSSSSSLSSARSTPEADELQILGLPDPKPYNPMVECSYCGQEIDKFVLEDFEDTYNTGGDLAQKWKRRFCNFHKAKEAQETWQERSYPVIEWTSLERRMRQHNAFLIDVLNDRKPSHYREILKGKVKPRAKGPLQKWTAAEKAKDGGSKPGAAVGYYGPRGEKMMTDHIISYLNDEIREQADKDKLIASSGVEGGVPGFVQAVLVPHLAELLIKEDMSLTGVDWSFQARDIIADGCELGEILHPEIEEGIVEIDDEGDDDRYD